MLRRTLFRRGSIKELNEYPVLGTLDSLDAILEKRSINEVILAMGDISQKKLDQVSRICASYRVPLRRFQIKLEDIFTAKTAK